MKNTDDFVFKALHVIAWIIFVGLSIEAGALLVTFAFSIFKPETVPLLYQKLDLSPMYARSQMAFYSIYSLILSVAVLKAFLFYKLIELTTKIDLNKPFKDLISKQIYTISYFTFTIGMLSYFGRETAKQLTKRGFEIAGVHEFWVDSQAFILMAAVIYVIATIFKRGIELQNENELTV